jgi:hypothetical protein
MEPLPLVPTPVPALPPPGRLPRIEYLGFKNLVSHREFRLRVCRPEGPTEFLFRIAIDAFGVDGVRLQDGPDVCYQHLVGLVAAGVTGPDAITLDGDHLAAYVQAHTKAPKRPSWTPASTPKPPGPPPTPRRTPYLPVAPRVTEEPEPAFEEGQRVSHTVFGVGVTTSSNAGHTVVHFDQDGSKRFVTAMLVLDVLSEPHTWETGPRGKNRPCRTLVPPTDGA